MRNSLILSICTLLTTACSLSPEVLAAREAARAEEARRITLALAQRCDGETARLMALEYDNWPGVDAAEKTRLQAQLQSRYQSPAFQNCYQLARENLAYRRRLQDLEYREWQREMEWMRYRPPFFYGPPPFYW